jgi:hypothetical protein
MLEIQERHFFFFFPALFFNGTHPDMVDAEEIRRVKALPYGLADEGVLP